MMKYFCIETVNHLRSYQGMSTKNLQRSLDVTLACKLTLVYGKYHLMMLHRQLAMSEERTSFQQAERTADMMNKMTVFHSSPTDQDDRLSFVTHGLPAYPGTKCG